MRKTEGYKSIESYLFCQQQSRQAVSNARSSKHNRYSTCSAPPLPNFHRQSEWQGCRNCEFRHIKKKVIFPLPIITGNADGKVRVRIRLSNCVQSTRKTASSMMSQGAVRSCSLMFFFAIQTARGNATKSLRLQRIGPGIPCSVTNASAFR